MFRNILTVAWRRFLKSKSLYSITLIGFSMGIACSLLIFVYLYNEYSFESMHRNNNRTYRLALTSQMENKSTSFATTLPALGPALRLSIPEIEKTLRIVNEFSTGFIKIENGQNIKATNLLVAEPAFFDFFNYPFISGDSTSFKNPNSMVLTESLAKRLFGSQEALGKTVVLNNNTILKVGSVIQDPPANTHMQFEGLISWSTFLKDEMVWNDAYAYTYFMIAPNAKIKDVERKIKDYVKNNKQIAEVELALDTKAITDIQPLKDIHLYSHRFNELSESGNPGMLYIFLTIAIFFLFCSAFNYVNIAIANSMYRVKEVGMRKVFGASGKMIKLQFFVESLIIISLAVVLAIILTALLLQPFSRLIGQNVEPGIMTQPAFILFLVGLAVVITILSGWYPSFYLSSFNPVKIFRKKSDNADGGFLSLRKTLIVLQLMVSTGIIACTIIAVSQLKYLQNANIGFDKNNIVYFPVPVSPALGYIKQELTKDPDVVSLSASTYQPHRSGNDEYEIEQKDGQMAVYNVQKMFSDYSFVDLMGMKIVAGRNYSRDFGSDLQDAFVVNESMVKFFGWKDPIGKKIKSVTYGKTGTVIGVVNDASLYSLHNANSPMIFNLSTNPVNEGEALFVKYKTSDIRGLISKIKAHYDKALGGDLPFEYSFLDETYDSLYKSDERFRKVIEIGALLMIFISSLGLYGLSSFMALKRSGEVGIRKVLGATLTQIATLHVKGFFRMALLGVVLGLPLSYYISWKWLQTFTMRIDLKVWMFLAAGLVTIVTVVLTTAAHAYRLSTIKPVDTIKE